MATTVDSKTVQFPHFYFSHDPYWLLTHTELAIFFSVLPTFCRVS